VFSQADRRRLERGLALAGRRQRSAAAASVAGGQQAAHDGQHPASAVGGGQRAAAAVTAEFGPRVAELVAAVTNPVWRLGGDVRGRWPAGCA
jgi:hypothetical protein